VGIRQTLNENPAITAVATGVIIVAALIFIIVEALPHHPHPGPPAKQFYSDDDGQTWFPDSGTKIPPFTDANGKEAVLVYVYKCGQSGKEFVGYMLKYTPDGLKRMQDAQNQPGGRMMDAPPSAFTDTEVKKPGDPNWITRADDPMAFTRVMMPKCPDGGAEIFPVNPEMP
jgi:hypothetical protein